ncbi:DKNYY domain-containing protein [Leptothoe spongobia]|uniref:DKNYY domain-containing protein n=1 Tax=Leptothoe spongobia TAU-MAC 1115 TaxID=1967444 RepID=A0A947DCT1_9CYAN|nr:DKNYY domain-containing protein [Leptothoe spongobia]MBT9314024.1 DKNYY domain-containing protein [Leptothoe spongobia TAU-MAC 1115]
MGKILTKIGQFYLYGLLAIALSIALGIIWFKSNSGYRVRNGKVYFRTFDNLHWQFQSKEVQGANPTTIRTIPRSGNQYGTDNQGVFFGDVQLMNADPGSFFVLDWRQEYSRDADQIYWKSIPITDDVEHWEVLSQGYSKDRTHIYYGKTVVEGADPASFVVTGEGTSHAKDKNHSYNMGRRIN